MANVTKFVEKQKQVIDVVEKLAPLLDGVDADVAIEAIYAVGQTLQDEKYRTAYAEKQLTTLESIQ